MLSFGKQSNKFSVRLLPVIVLIFIVLIVSGCSSEKPEMGTPGDKNINESSNRGATQYPLTLNDDSGESISIPKEPERIISFVPSSTETLFALGLDTKVIGVTKWDTYPLGVQEKVEYVFEDSLNPNIEQIIRLKPDLIILGMHDSQTVAAIRNLQIPTVLFDPQNLNSTYDTIERLGLITNKQSEAVDLIAKMKNKEKKINEKISTLKPEQKLKVWIEVSGELFTAGKGTFLNELLEKAGGINIADTEGWAQFSSEQVIAKNPDVILVTYGYYDKEAVSNILSRRGWQAVKAIKEQNVVELDSDMVNRPGPRIIDGLESIAKTLYPQLF